MRLTTIHRVWLFILVWLAPSTRGGQCRTGLFICPPSPWPCRTRGRTARPHNRYTWWGPHVLLLHVLILDDHRWRLGWPSSTDIHKNVCRNVGCSECAPVSWFLGTRIHRICLVTSGPAIKSLMACSVSGVIQQS